MKKQILVVDDSESIREVVTFSLEKAGHKVNSAENGREAIKFLEWNSGIDLIITDLHMPVMDGIEFIKKVRKMEEYSYIPILFLTTESQLQRKNEAREAGASGWLVKPFVPEHLLTAISKLVR